MTGVFPVTSGHDPAAAPRIAAAGACPTDASANFVTIHALQPSSVVPKPAGISPAAVTPVTVAGHAPAPANSNQRLPRRITAKQPERNFILLTSMAIAAVMLIVLTAASYAQGAAQ